MEIMTKITRKNTQEVNKLKQFTYYILISEVFILNYNFYYLYA